MEGKRQSVTAAFGPNPRTEHLEGSFGGTKPDMRDLASVGALLRGFEKYEEENRVERWERLNVLVQEHLDGLHVTVLFEDEGLPVMSFRQHTHLPAALQKGDVEDFRAFQEWVYAHDAELFSALGKRFVLIGSWVGGLQRGVHYSRLPSPFLAVDLYDTTTNAYLSYDLMVEVLGTVAAVPTAPVLWRSLPPPPFPPPTAPAPGAHFEGLKSQLRLPTALRQRSAFGDEPLEGLNIRIERGGETTHHRFKLVREVGGADSRGPKANVVLATQ